MRMKGHSLHDINFRKFITDIIEPAFWKDAERYLNSFDLALEWIRRDRNIISSLQFAETSSKFQYHDFIENWYRTETNMTRRCLESPQTVFIHGRYLKR